MWNLLRHFTRGASGFKYGLLVALIGVGAIGTVAATGERVAQIISTTEAALPVPGAGGAPDGAQATPPFVRAAGPTAILEGAILFRCGYTRS